MNKKSRDKKLRYLSSKKKIALKVCTSIAPLRAL